MGRWEVGGSRADDLAIGMLVHVVTTNSPCTPRHGAHHFLKHVFCKVKDAQLLMSDFGSRNFIYIVPRLLGFSHPCCQVLSPLSATVAY